MAEGSGETTVRVLVLYTGGTIGMRLGTPGYQPVKGFLREQLLALPQFHDPRQAELTTPPSAQGLRVHYTIEEFDPLLDSAAMGLDDWARIARAIGQAYDAYHAFVVLHGTDTMAYSASALSFMLENLGKPVVLTGAQIPLALTRSDGVGNLLGALAFAGHYEIPEVCIYFHNRLFRGNRASKEDALGFDAFRSPNFPPLAEVGVDFDIHWPLVLEPTGEPLRVHAAMSPHVASIRLFPGLTAKLIDNVLRPPLRGLVLETFGSGNAPDNRPDFLWVIREAVDRGVVIVNCSQCQKGRVRTTYATGRALADAGVVPGADMTAEAALAKLCFLLGQGLPPAEVARLVPTSLRGELTEEARERRSWRAP